MVGENGTPETPDWSVSACIKSTPSEALRLPLLWPGDNA